MCVKQRSVKAEVTAELLLVAKEIIFIHEMYEMTKIIDCHNTTFKIEEQSMKHEGENKAQMVL